jgi:GTP:adenosylcobinamide-phosphate guanylyltransferase
MAAAAPDPRFTALVLAADRGPDDPVARAGGRRRKCLVEVAGRPMLARVAAALLASRWVGDVAVSIDEPELLATLPELEPALRQGRLRPAASAATPSLSVLAAMQELGSPLPFLVTTADHALLSTAMVDHFCAQSRASGADVSVGLTASALVLGRYPQAVRTFLAFKDERYSGSNLFAFLSPRGLEAARFWRRVEQDRKRPWRVARAFGPRLLLCYVLRRLSLDQAVAAAGRRIGVAAAAVKMPFAEAAIDVDKPEDLALADQILRAAG